MAKRRVVSGIQPSGDIHLGNYLGAIKRWVAEQDEKENFYFIANLHALTTKSNIRDLRDNTHKTLSWLLATGLKTSKSTLYVQSQIPEHSELCWILNNFVTMGELSRMTQFKDKNKRLGADGQLVGLFDYPVLQVADVLLYDADEVPVGRDQKQHVELMRNIAARFNKQYGEVFKLPKPDIQEVSASIMNLKDPAKKMSKSDFDQGGVVSLADDEEAIRTKIRKAVTDTGNTIKVAEDKPAISNLMRIFALLGNYSVSEVESRYAGKSYAEFKNDLAELTVEVIRPIRARYNEYMTNTAALDKEIVTTQKAAQGIATKKMTQVKAVLGLA